MSTSTKQFNFYVTPEGLTSIVNLDNAPNSPCELIIQNMNGNGNELYLGNSNMWNEETYGLKLLDGMSMSIRLGAYDELYAFANGYFNITVLKTSGNGK